MAINRRDLEPHLHSFHGGSIPDVNGGTELAELQHAIRDGSYLTQDGARFGKIGAEAEFTSFQRNRRLSRHLQRQSLNGLVVSDGHEALSYEDFGCGGPRRLP